MKWSREELIELASRDALGMLDPDESEAFEAAFRRADADTRRELRVAQDDIIALGELLIDARPDEDLRDRTVGHVAELIERQPAPTLKRRVLGEFERFVEEDLRGSLQFPPAGAAAPRRGDWVERFAAGRVSPMWRIAALVLLTVTLGLTWFGVDAYSNAMRMADAMVNNRIEEIIAVRFGQLPEDFWFNPESRLSSFTVADSGFKGRAMLAVINSQDRGFLAAINMPDSSDPYRLLMGYGDLQDARPVAEFYAKGGTCSVPISLGGAADVSGAKWWIMGPSASNEGELVALLEIIPDTQ